MVSKSAILAAAAIVLITLPAEAQSRRSSGRDRVEAARAQGVPPGQLPPPDECRVWYDGRPNGRQPRPTSCRQAEAIAQRDRNARVIYGVDAYRDRRYGRSSEYPGDRYPDTRRYPDAGRHPDNDRAVPRRGDVRNPRISGGVLDSRDRRGGYGSAAFQNGYRDGLTKGREDAEDGDRSDASRHGWFRSASRGYETRFGSREEYRAAYRDGFEAGYAEGYRVYARR